LAAAAAAAVDDGGVFLASTDVPRNLPLLLIEAGSAAYNIT
jgi:hypothetical protein